MVDVVKEPTADMVGGWIHYPEPGNETKIGFWINGIKFYAVNPNAIFHLSGSWDHDRFVVIKAIKDGYSDFNPRAIYQLS
jgi:hypothetical protein